jgi:DNA polymerase (family 10)
MEGRDQRDVARILVELGQRLLLAGENAYRARAYSRAAESLLGLTVPLEDVIAQNRLREVPGVGAALEGVIRQLWKEGTTPKLEQLRSEVPAGVLQLLRIPGISPDKVLRIYRELGTESLDDLEAACRAGRVANAKGLGASLQGRLLSGIELMRRSQGQRLIQHAEDLLSTVAANLRRSHPELSRIAFAGDLRRGCELVSELALLAEVQDGDSIRVLSTGSDVKLWLADRDRYGLALLLATGSLDHIAGLQEVARQRAFSHTIERSAVPAPIGGVLVARKGGVPKERVLNCLDASELEAWFKASKARVPGQGLNEGGHHSTETISISPPASAATSPTRRPRRARATGEA